MLSLSKDLTLNFVDKKMKWISLELCLKNNVNFHSNRIILKLN